MNHTNQTTPAQRIWVIGAGKFGRISVDALRGDRRRADITVVDNDPDQLEHMVGTAVTTILADGIDFLNTNLVSPDAPDWIIPVIPVHVAAEWIRARLEPAGAIRWRSVPESVIAGLPNPMIGPNGEVYASLADFLCPDNCPQPPECCTCTGDPRPYSLHQKLAALQLEGFRSVVITSRQLAPGVGALSPPDLFRALAQTVTQRSPCLLSTACRCHGVVSAIEWEPTATLHR